MNSSDRVFVALDFASGSQALQLVERLGSATTHYKVGLQLLTAEGPSIVRSLVAQGKHVFLDLKLLEIPNSVGGAVEAAGRLGARMVTVHASGGSAVLKAAVAAAKPFSDLRVLALTVITSMREHDLNEVGVPGSVQDQVSRLAGLAIDAGCHGVVASAEEAQALRDRLPSESLIVTPGIQLPDATINDQARVATPSHAIRCGASHVVIGRAIARASEPSDAFRDACMQVEAARVERAQFASR